MKDDEMSWNPKQVIAALPVWLMVIGGTAASLVLAGLMADVGLALALVGFVVLLVRLHRAPED